MRCANPIPAAFIRGGTSKGIFLKRSDLPQDKSQWNRIFLGLMGSPDKQYGRQLNGMGGGISSLSKIMVIEPSKPGAPTDIDYTFVQIGVRDAAVDYSGNCGNLSSMAGVFALDQGLCKPRTVVDSLATVRSLNTNTNKIIDTTFPVNADGTPRLDLPEVEMAGVPGKASAIRLDFVNPGGARTGKLLPTGSPVNTVTLPSGRTATVSLVDATNPTVFVGAEELAEIIQQKEIDFAKSQVLETLEQIRQEGAKAMEIDPSAQSQPKIAILEKGQDGSDIRIKALSMGVLHKAVPMTVGLCLGIAARIPGTLAHRLCLSRRPEGAEADQVRIEHPGGLVDVLPVVSDDAQTAHAVGVIRTGRYLMTGAVYWE